MVSTVVCSRQTRRSTKPLDSLFEALDVLDARLGARRYLLSTLPTEPDWRLFACLLRFDAVYASLRATYDPIRS